MLLGEGAHQWPRAGDDDGAERDLQRAFARAAVNLAAHDVVDGSRSGEDDARANDGAGANDGSFVNAAVAADYDVILDDDRHVADWLQHTADLRGRGEMYALADLRTGADQGMRVDHRLLVDVGADV